jgi:hypothetical protein
MECRRPAGPVRRHCRHRRDLADARPPSGGRAAGASAPAAARSIGLASSMPACHVTQRSFPIRHRHAASTARAVPMRRPRPPRRASRGIDQSLRRRLHAALAAAIALAYDAKPCLFYPCAYFAHVIRCPIWISR